MFGWLGVDEVYAKSSKKIWVGISQALGKDLCFEIKGKKISVKEITDLIDQHLRQNP